MLFKPMKKIRLLDLVFSRVSDPAPGFFDRIRNSETYTVGALRWRGLGPIWLNLAFCLDWTRDRREVRSRLAYSALQINKNVCGLDKRGTKE